MKKNRAKSPIFKSQEYGRNKENKNVNQTREDLETNKFKDQMNNGKANVLVCVRCRPITKKETEISNIETIKILNKKIVVVMDPIEYNGHEEVFKNRSREQQYAFDYVFDKNSGQEEVYEHSSKFLITGAIQGYNATVFAYGSTGAGKTYTMLGTGKEPGIMVKSLGDLFMIIENTNEREFKIKLSYVEVYNESIRDLLGSGDNLDLREDPAKGSIIVGINEIEVNTSTQVFELLLKGNKSRTTESTNMNETSSRSHAVLQILVESKLKNSSELNSGKFILVDLAGSERAANTQNSGIRLIEGANINKSLLSLGNCINALVDISNGASKTFIPWRDSKLTRILKDSLGGNSRIVMIANISPSLLVLEETLNTLKYANRAKNIKTNAKRNVLDVDYHINKYDEVISGLKSELENLRHELAVKTHNTHILKNSFEVEKQNPINKVEKANKEITSHFQEEIKIRKELNEEEKKIDSLYLDLKEKEYELYKQLNLGINTKERGSGLKQKEIKNSIVKINEQIESIKKNLNDKIYFHNDLMKRREDLQNMINKVSKEPLGSSLTLTYQYYIVLLDNLSLEHKKNMNLLSLKQKEIKLNKLIDQIKLRDELINKANNELNKKGVKIKQTEQIKPLESLNIEHSFVLPVVISSSNDKNFKLPQNYINKQNYQNYQNKQNYSNYQIKVTSPNESLNMSRSKSPYEGYSNPNIIKEKKKFKSKTTEIIEKAKKNELTDLKLHVINELYPNSKLYYLNSKNPNKKFSTGRMQNVISLDTKNLNHSYDKINTSISSNKTLDNSYSISRREREVDKKVKNILLRKNIVGRHKNSPYLNNFNKL